MSDQTPPPPPPSTPPPGGFPPAPPASGFPPAPAYGAHVAPMGPGPLGKIRPTGISILLAIVTLGIYTFVWVFQVHEELKRHTGRGLGGLVALLLWFFASAVVPFFTSAEIGNLRKATGREERVSAMTGLWYFPGMFIIVGPIVWFVKTNAAINDYWASQGVRA